ncbi:putative cytochrome c mitochondrial import factor [Aspergillus bertholletiae]|uniref:Putative cytochrome c mitochondrial import factor n=1 Tax=Aspergillus bertholletiae TaxID=1226010 RepID=A0A5N7B830_9EURO|nr:putative cytochrome c mitochondrial import factor [Aspergillus bertholletiae]
MKPRTSARTLSLFSSPFPPCPSVGRIQRRHVFSSSSSSSSSPPALSPSKQRPWLRVAIVTIAAAGIGAYVRSQEGSKSTTLNPITFTPYYLVSKEPVSSTGCIFTLKAPKPASDNGQVYDEAWRTGVWSVMFKQPQLQIGRDYTPLPPTSVEEDEESLRFFIRRDPFGEMSRYLHGLDMGTRIEMRGPQIECEIPSDTQHILFIAGGTGIAPALQAGHTLLSRTDGTHKPSIHILWANRSRDDCVGGTNDNTMTSKSRASWFAGLWKPSPTEPSPADSSKNTAPFSSLLVRELENLKAQYPGQVTVDYFVDEENTFIGKKAILDVAGSTAPAEEPQKRKMILVSGPEGFISYMAGPKLWAQGMELQGPLQGIIRELDLKDWAVWKL